MIRDIFKTSFLNIWPLIVIVTVTLVLVRFFYIRYHKPSAKFYREFWTYIAILYMLLLYELVTRVDVNMASGYNIVPFREIFRYEINSKLFIYNVFGNIALFMPFGFIVSAYIKPKRIWPSLLIAIIVSTTTEFVQLNIGRSFDIDDIILNTIGCILGSLLFIGAKAIHRHLPKVLKSDWLNNLICIIITIIMIVAAIHVLGISF